MIKLLVRNTSINILTEALTSIFGVVLFMAVGRIMGPAKIGIFSFAMTIGAVWSQLPNFGFEKLIARDIGSDTKNSSHYFKYITSTKIVFLVIALIGVAVTIRIADYSAEKSWVVFISSLTMFLFSFIGMFCSFFRAFQRAEYEAFLRVSTRFGNFVFGLSALYLGTGLIGFTISQSIVALIAMILGIILINKRIFKITVKWSVDKSKQFVKMSSPFILLSVLVMLYVSIATLFLNAFKGDYETGIYAAAGKLIQSMLFLPTAVSSAFLPAMSKLYQSRENDRLFIKTYAYVLKYLFLIGIGMAAGFTMLSEDICIFLYGEEFAKSGTPLSIMGWAMVLSFINFVMVNTIIAVGKEKLCLYVSAGGVIINISFNLWAIPIYGYNGAAMSTIITEGFVVLAHYFIIKPFLGKDFSFIRLMHKPVWAAAGMSGILFLFTHYIPINFHILVTIAVGVIFFILFTIILRTIEPSELQLFKDVLSKKGMMNTSSD